MSLKLTTADVAAITRSIAPDRLSTYAAPAGSTDPLYPLSLYSWNVKISGAFLVPLQIFEVVMRNAIAEGLENKYGARWPWDRGFEWSLPAPARGYNPRQELQYVKGKVSRLPTSKAIPEFTLAFWSHLLTSRHDTRIWDHHLLTVFPHLPSGISVSDGRKKIHDDMEVLRKFRNRIAHHEPILKAPLSAHLNVIRELVSFRCPSTTSWLDQIETVSATLGQRP